jgi:hypothetical protein
LTSEEEEERGERRRRRRRRREEEEFVAFEGKNGKKWEKIIMGWDGMGCFFFLAKNKNKKKKTR